MRVTRAALPLLLVLGLSAAAASVAPRDIEATGAPNAAYLDAVRWRGLQTEIVYLRPEAPSPEGEVGVPDAPGVPDPAAVRRNWAIAAGAVLLAVLAFAAWYGRGIPVSFGRGRDPLRRGSAAAAGAVPDRALSADDVLAALRAMPDRRQALVLLVGRALERAAQANGLRLGRAQTARDVLGALPRGWPHLDRLRRLVGEAEIVHYGGRDLAEERWRDCLDVARPLFGAGQAA